jgi:hypothetical protein
MPSSSSPSAVTERTETSRKYFEQRTETRYMPSPQKQKRRDQAGGPEIEA